MDRIMGFFDEPMLINLAIQLFNTLVLSGVLYLILYKPVKKFMENRTNRIKSQIANAESDYMKAKDLKVEYESKLKTIDEERVAILETARKQALANRDQIIAEAREEAQTLIKRAHTSIEREMEKANDEVRKQMIEISSMIASRYVAGSIDQNMQNKLLDEVISDLGDAKWLS